MIFKQKYVGQECHKPLKHKKAGTREVVSLQTIVRVPHWVQSYLSTQVPWGQSVRSQGWKQIKGSFIQKNKQQLGQKESLNHGHLGEKYKVKM